MPHKTLLTEDRLKLLHLLPWSIDLTKRLVFEEGWVNNVYPDPQHKNILTIGVGHNLITSPKWSSNGNPIQHYLTDEEVASLLSEDINEVVIQLKAHWPYFKIMNPSARKSAMIMLCFQIGIVNFMKFVHMKDAIEHCNYTKAAQELTNSEWAREVPDRVDRLITQVTTGQYYEIPV